MNHIKPEVFSKTFTCPYCLSIAQQRWWSIDLDGHKQQFLDRNELRVGACTHCAKPTVWIRHLMIYPQTGGAPPPNSEMAPEVAKLYLEAAAIFSLSPRAAAALLRLAVQVLCISLGEPGKNINLDIASLVSKGLPVQVQQSLDFVRVTGNNAVHPGQIDTDDPNNVRDLFELVNLIVEYMVAMPNRVNSLYSSLPSNALSAINKRDA
jgi:Domain of unknown function (DUF4145)